jgi:prepilin-type N-terminal cleavage/methylation domain-containing protein/prepilin-type processing-associated H-X9-DG protein
MKAQQEAYDRRQRRAFTVTELLVVISIIGVLAAILVPVVGKAKAAARKIQCLAFQKQWYVAFHNYVNENDNLIPREGYEADGQVVINNWTQVVGRLLPDGRRDSDDVWYNALPRSLTGQPTSSYSAPPSRRREFYNRNNMIHCPSARFPDRAFKLSTQEVLFSMAMNSQLIQAGEGPTINWGLVEAAARIPIFLDNLLEGEAKVHPNQDDEDLGQPASHANRFSARHRGQGNIVFADGHAASFWGRQVVETDPASDMLGGKILNPSAPILWDVYTY